jgi:hypothetical protein
LNKISLLFPYLCATIKRAHMHLNI